MNERVRKTIVFAALPLAIIWGAYNLLQSPSTTEIKRPETIQPLSAGTPQEASAPTFDTLQIAQAEWGGDPFRMKTTLAAASANRDWTVTGIVFNASSPVAYVNRQMVREGDTVDKARVISINRKSVVLEYQGDRFEISITRG